MKRIHLLLAGALLCASLGAAAQRMSVAPEAFLDDVGSIASASRLGSALLALDSQRKAWGDYCSDSQALARQGEFRQAIRAATKALHLGVAQHGGQGAAVIWSTNDIATAYSYAGDHATAQAWAGRTLEAIAKGYNANDRQAVLAIRANAHRIRALAQSQQGAHAAALAELAQGQEALPSIGAAASRAELETVQAMLLLRAGQAEAASALADRLLKDGDALARLGAARVAGEAALARRDAAAAQRHFDAAVGLATERKDAYQVVLAKVGQARAARLAGQADAAGRRFEEALADLERLRRRFHSLEMRTALYGNLQSVFDEAVEFLAGQGQAERALQVSEAGRARAMLDLQGKVEGPSRAPVGQVRTLAQIQAALGADQHMVVYHQLPGQLIAWGIGRGGMKMQVLPIAGPALHGQVEAWRRSIERNEPGAVTQAQALHAVLLAPLQVPPKVPLVVVPHRSLHLLPFQALHDGRQWLVEQHAVSTVLSASLLEARPYASQEAALAAVGNPDLGKPEWALPGAQREVLALGKLYGRSQVAVGPEASKSRLLGMTGNADVVHVAAHAVIDEVDPMYSVIKLAAVGGTPQAGAQASDLQARELAALDLSRAQLIALSACSSGVGTVAQGDEFMGFKRALLAAGARSAVVSLWVVDDEATELLMTRFHQAWRQGSRAQALREAQLSVLNQPKLAHPYYWAPFVLVGDPG